MLDRYMEYDPDTNSETDSAFNRISALSNINMSTLKNIMKADDYFTESAGNIETGLYKLPNNQIVFIGNLGEGNYTLTKYYYSVPTEIELNKRIKECE